MALVLSSRSTRPYPGHAIAASGAMTPSDFVEGGQVNMRRIERARRALLRTFVESRSAQPVADDRREPTPRRIGARRRREGQSLVEFAVVLPIFLLLLAGLVDFGIGLYSQMTIINAAREGARLGIVELGVPGVDVAAAKGHITDKVAEAASGLDTDTTITCVPTCASGNALVVQVDYPYKMLWPLAFGNKIDLTSSVQMRIE
jgi:Flp pilus assembly protein TadG